MLISQTKKKKHLAVANLSNTQREKQMLQI